MRLCVSKFTHPNIWNATPVVALLCIICYAIFCRCCRFLLEPTDSLIKRNNIKCRHWTAKWLVLSYFASRIKVAITRLLLVNSNLSGYLSEMAAILDDVKDLVKCHNPVINLVFQKHRRVCTKDNSRLTFRPINRGLTERHQLCCNTVARSLKNSGLNGIRTHDLCDAGAAFQLWRQSHLGPSSELAIVWRVLNVLQCKHYEPNWYINHGTHSLQ